MGYKMINVLMTGAGAPGAPGIIRCFKQDKNINLIVCDANEHASGRYLNEIFELVPMANESNFIESILYLCEKYKIDVVFPLVTRELFLFAEHKEDFKNKGIEVLVSDLTSLNIANDKSALYLHLEKNDIPTPNFKVANTFSELQAAFNCLDFPNKPVCIKPSISNGSRGVRIIDNTINEYELLFNHKPNSLYMSYDKMCDILKEKSFPQLLVSEVLPGDEYTIDTVIHSGEAVAIIPRKRTKMNAGISVAGEFEEHKDIIDYCKQIISSLELTGNIGLQVKKAVDGAYKILEINPRIQGTSVAALGAGVNLPLMAVYKALDMPYKVPTINWNIGFVRYYEEVFYPTV